MKVGRNAPCPCGSGRKYKRCCGDPAKSMTSSSRSVPFIEQPRVQEMLRAQRAAENVRQQQQGYGRPIVSWLHDDHRMVAVGMTVFWAKDWTVFTDFLFYYLKQMLGFEWGSRG